MMLSSKGPQFKAFISEASEGIYKGSQLSGLPEVEKLDKFKTALTTQLLASFAKRFTDATEGFVSATSVANLATWPAFTGNISQEVKGKKQRTLCRFNSSSNISNDR
jgi:hypothetical protein